MSTVSIDSNDLEAVFCLLLKEPSRKTLGVELVNAIREENGRAVVDDLHTVTSPHPQATTMTNILADIDAAS
ncbi:hypothetical protein DFP74_2335 [Nocardiopsis sp. Huas11]|uniref:hypothetical protein n=1 Tax=Nocardiopsis sp. Huas11 TaxID=2183912 RepID=UPI000EAF8626|nr:hypothetical protein [Nocardiopsis sp. Huas11]RKS06692.1 hypothetical protein DFP74_2335 [Nocardiopsis sp. Huas11]